MQLLTLPLRSLREALLAAQTNGEVSFEEKRALRWLSDAKNAAPLAPAEASVEAPAVEAAPPPVDEMTAAAPPVSPAASVPQPAAPLPVAMPEAPEALAPPQEAPAAEAPQVIDSMQAPVEPAALPASASLDSARFPSASP